MSDRKSYFEKKRKGESEGSSNGASSLSSTNEVANARQSFFTNKKQQKQQDIQGMLDSYIKSTSDYASSSYDRFSQDSYRDDTETYMDDAYKRRGQSNRDADSIRRIMYDTGFDKDYYTRIDNLLRQAQGANNNIYNYAKSDNDFMSQHDEKSYGRYKQHKDLVNSAEDMSDDELKSTISRISALRETAKDKTTKDGYKADVDALSEIATARAEKAKLGQYSKLWNNDDFTENSKYNPMDYSKTENRMKKFTDEDAAKYDYINDAEWARETYDSSHGGVMSDMKRYQTMTKDEVATYNYLYNTQGSKKAQEYLNALAPTVNDRKTEEVQNIGKQFADKVPVLPSIVSTAGNLFTGSEYVDQALNMVTGGDLRSAPRSDLSAFVDSIRGEVGERWSQGKLGGTKFFGSTLGNFGYQTLMSMTDFVSSLALGSFLAGGSAAAGGLSGIAKYQEAIKNAEPFVLGLMGTQAAGRATSEALQEGMPQGKAFFVGTMAGAAEIISEKVSVDALMADPKSVAGYLWKNFKAEGGEEIESNFMNNVVDLLVSGDQGKIKGMYNDYISQGLNSTDALRRVLLNLASEDATSFLGGALSGLAMGAGGLVTSNIMQNNVDTKTGAELKKDNLGEYTVNMGLSMDKNSEAYKLAMELNGVDASDKQMGKLNRYVAEQADNESIAAISRGVEQRLAELGETDVKTTTNAVMKTIQGEKLTKEDKAAIKAQYGGRVINEFFNRSTGEYSSSWTEKPEHAYEQKKTVAEEASKPILEAMGYNVKDEQDVKNNIADAFVDKQILSDDGTVSYEGKSVSIIGIEGINKGNVIVKVKTDDGVVSTDIKNVSLANYEQALLYAYASKYNTRGARAFVDGYKGGNVKRYANTFDRAYQYGYNGLSQQSAMTSIEREVASGVITSSEAVDAYFQGIKAKIISTAKRQSKIEKLKAYVKENGAVVSVKDGKVTEVNRPLNDMQKASIRAIQALSKATGRDFVIFESKADENGVRNEANGFVDENGVIHIDLFAGNKGEGAMLRTLAHEITHTIKEDSPKLYEQLADHLTSTYGKHGVSMEQLISRQIEKAKESKLYSRDISWEEAKDEVIANSCEMMLKDNEGINKLALENMNVFKKVKAIIDDFVKAIETAMKGLKAESLEARLLEKWYKDFKDIQEIWTKAFLDAQETRGTISTSALNQFRYSERNQTSIKEQLENNSDLLNNMDIVASIKEFKTFKSKQEIVAWVLKRIENIGYNVNRKGFGVIVLDEKRIKNGLRYLKTNEERLAFAAVPQVLKKGVEISSHTQHKGRTYDTVTFAAPVEINGQRGNLAVVVREEGKNYYKVHRLVMPDGTQFIIEQKNEDIAERAGGVNKDSGLSPTDTVFNNSVPQSPSESQKNILSERDNDGNQLSPEQQEYFKDSKIRDESGNLQGMYHGTRRGDRVGNYFDPNKATSGPMAFFTSSEEIASNYSRDKQDTSLSREYDTEYDLFKVNGKGLDEYWRSLPAKDKMKMRKEASNIGFDDDFEGIVYSPGASKNSFGDQYQWRLGHEYSGNAIKALYSLFIEDGNLMNEDMAKFKDALEKAGVENVEYLDPYHVEPKVYKTYLNITNPFDTSNMPEDMINQFKEVSKTAKVGEQYSADMWDKSNIEPENWIRRLEDDLKNGTTHAWTVIPDWVTDALKKNGYDGIVDTGGKNGGATHKVAIPFYSNQIKLTTNINPTENVDIRYSEREKEEYSYDSLVSKPNMNVTVLGENVPSNRADVIYEAKKNAAKVGKHNKDGSVSVYVKDIDKEVLLGTNGLRHSIDRRFNTLAPVVLKSGEILNHSIRINELNPREDNVKKTYVLVGAAKNINNEPFIVSFVVNSYSNELMSMDVVYSVNAKANKKGPAALNVPGVATKDVDYLTDPTISISNLLDYVNKYYPDILPEDVLKHYGYTSRPEGKLGDSALYSERDKESMAETAEKHFGVTENMNESGYITINGKSLDFSGKHRGSKKSGYREVDHTEVSEILPKDFDTFALLRNGTKNRSGSLAMWEFEKYGNIRTQPETGSIELAMAPTKAQQEKLTQYFKAMRTDGKSTIRVDINDITDQGKIYPVAALKYERNASTDMIILDIIEYYKRGKLPEGVNEFSKTIQNGWMFSERDLDVYDNTAILKEETIDRYLADYASKSSLSYAQAYICYMSPNGFLHLTTGGTEQRNRIVNQSSEFNYSEFSDATLFQPIQMRINSKTGEVQGHEGRHRMVALENAGVTKVPVLLFDSTNKYSKEKLSEKYLHGQFDATEMVKAKNIIPLSAANRDEIIKDFGMSSSLQKMQEAVDGTKTLIYSQRDNDNGSLIKRNKYLEGIVADLRHQFELTDHEIDEKQLTRALKKLVKDNFSDYPVASLTIEIKQIAEQMRVGKLTDEEIAVSAERMGDRILQNEIPQYSDDAKQVLAYLKDRRFYIPEAERSNVIAKYGSMRTYLNMLMGSIKYTYQQGSIPIDTLWQDLSKQFPSEFPEDTNIGDMGEVLAENIQKYRTPMPIENTPENNPGYYDEATLLGFELLDTYFNIPEVKTFADKQKAKLDMANASYKAKLQQYRGGYEARLEKSNAKYAEARATVKKLREELNYAKSNGAENERWAVAYERKKAELDKARMKELYMKLYTAKKQSEVDARLVLDMRLGEQQKRYTDILKKRIENDEKYKVRKAIKKYMGELSVKLANPTAKKHIPSSMISTVYVLLESISIESKSMAGDRITNNINAFKSSYHALADNDNNPLMQNVFDTELYAEIDAFTNKISKANINDLSLEYLKELYDLVRATMKTVSDANKAFYGNRSILAMGNSVVSELRGKEKTKHVVLGKPFKLAGKLIWKNFKPIYAFRHIGSSTLMDAYNNVRNGEGVWANDIYEAREKFKACYTKYNCSTWNVEPKTFKLKSGKTVELSMQQMLTLYTASKREQYTAHLLGGGFVFKDAVQVKEKKNGIPMKYEVNTASAYRLTETDIKAITDSLTDEQKKYANEMQRYLAIDMGIKGNEITTKMYDFEKFKDKTYFPIKSSDFYLAFNGDMKNAQTSIKNSAFTKDLVKKANNPIVLDDFNAIWANHIDGMCLYHAFTLPLEDFTRIYNYRTPVVSQAKVGQDSVKTSLYNAFQANASSYIEQFLIDVNGGVRTRGGEISSSLFGRFKKNAVFASASVAIQQPSAIARAFAYIDTKYFTQTTFAKRDYEELSKYAPIAKIKKMGYFDVNISKSTTDWLISTSDMDYNSLGEKAKAMFTDSGYRDDVLSVAPEKADEITWCHIWNACKAEMKAKTNLKGEELLKLAGRRFEEVVQLTQVYDSVFSRSEFMRSNNGFDKLASAFMAEPTVSANMLYDAFTTGRRDKKFLTRVLAAWMTSVVFNALLQSIVTAARDDDEYANYIEKYFGHVAGNLKDSLNPLTLVPYLNDVYEMLQGYTVERADLTIISDIVDATVNLGSDKLSVEDKIKAIAGALGAFVGVPVKNVLRDMDAVKNVVSDIFGGIPTTSEGIGYEVKKQTSGGDGKYLRLYSSVESGKGLRETVKMYTDNGSEKKDLATAITSHYKPLYLKYLKTDRSKAAEIKARILSAYTYLGYDRNEKLKAIEKWTE